MKFMKTFAIFIFVQSALFLSACNTGLGDSVDIKGPKVTIESPEARENVPKRFDIRGLVTDDFAVGTVTVELDGTIWQHNGSGWQKKAKGADSFVPDPDSEWIAASKKSVSWTIKNATIYSKEGGTYTIEVRAIDESGNSSEESTKSRDVIIDKSAPKITISSPNLVQEKSTFLDIPDYKDITKVTQFLTGDFNISGKTSEENGIKYVEVLIKEDGTQDDDSYLFKKRIVQSESDRTSESDIVVDALRSWEIPVTLAECDDLRNLNEKKHILKILTSTGDTAGNDSGVTFQGYACMWKEADKPWIDIILGDEVLPKNVYSGSSILGNAYDDTAIKSVNVTIKKKGVTSALSDEWNKRQIYSADDDKEDQNNVYFELPLPTDSDVYLVEITATDKKDKVSDTKTGWVKVVDKTFPSVDVSHKEGGKLFCDENGDFTLTIESKDETEVKSLKMAYIINPTDTIEYSDSNSGKWINNPTNLNDLKEGKVYTIGPKDTEKTVYENGLTRKIYENKVTINIFNDLGIDIKDRKLTNQTFVFRVEDGDGNALTSTYAIQGDIDSPEIEFTKLEYYSYEGSNPSDTRDQEGKDKDGNISELPPFSDKTVVKIYGKISDNSSYIWGSGGTKALPKLEIKANGMIQASKDVTVENDGTFVATARNLNGASLVFEVTATDLGGNTETKKYSLLVDSQTSKVEYISALNPDEYYKAGDTIDIFIHFNKKLNFSGTTSITLNNGKTIEGFKTKDGTNKNIGENDILFEYKIAQGDDTDQLTVNEVKFGNVKDGSQDVTEEMQTSIDAITGNAGFGKNLGQMKKIGIITSVPNITGMEYNETNSTLTITYDKAVAKGKGDVEITQSNVDSVPAVLSEAEGRIFFANSPGLKQYYDLTTNGATKGNDGSFKADLTSKYVLKYENDSNNEDVIKAYLATGACKLSQNVRAQGVEIDGRKVTVKFNSPLPCKGATYEIKVLNGFMQDKNGGSKFSATGRTDSYIAQGIEAPVIRINKGTATTVNANWTAKQPLTTAFKVDCQTPGVTLQYDCDQYTREAFTVVGHGSDNPTIVNYINTQNPTNSLNAYIANKGQVYNTSGRYETPVTLGNEANHTGLEYNITATAIKGTDRESAYAVAYRTTIEITGLVDNDVPNIEANWNGLDKTKCRGIGIFIRGGDVLSGSNITQGLPTNWDTNDYEKVCLLTKEGNSTYYFTTWAITTDYYFRVLAGLMDYETLSDNTKGISQGPYGGISAQNSWTSFYDKYPVPPGGHTEIQNTGTGGEGLLFEMGPKVQKYRQSQ